MTYAMGGTPSSVIAAVCSLAGKLALPGVLKFWVLSLIVTAAFSGKERKLHQSSLSEVKVSIQTIAKRKKN